MGGAAAQGVYGSFLPTECDPGCPGPITEPVRIGRLTLPMLTHSVCPQRGC